MNSKVVTAIYSPLCLYNGAFLSMLEEWLDGTGFRLDAVPFSRAADREREWLMSEGVMDSSERMCGNAFIRVFHQGRMIDSVPLDPARISRELGISITSPHVPPLKPTVDVSACSFLRDVFEGRVQTSDLTLDTIDEEMSMCLCHYPFGNPHPRYHDRCRAVKRPVLEEALSLLPGAGVFLRSHHGVLGLVEAMPREVLRRHGYMVGRGGADSDYVSIGCYEVARGMPRPEAIDRLMASLLQRAGDLFAGRTLIEGVGRLGWTSGFNPYWVYEKHGFEAREELRPGWLLMERALSS